MIQFHNGFEYDLKVGQDGESEFSNLLRKDRPTYTVECKRDMEVHKSGNLFIEVESRGKASGIEHTGGLLGVYDARQKGQHCGRP